MINRGVAIPGIEGESESATWGRLRTNFLLSKGLLMSGWPRHFVTDQFQHFFEGVAAGNERPGEKYSAGSMQIQ